MDKAGAIIVRIERHPHRDAVIRVREALRRLRRAGAEIRDQVERAHLVAQEECNETDSSPVCQGIDFAAGTRSND